MEYGKKPIALSMRTDVDPAAYKYNYGSQFRAGDGSHETMYCPWCHRWGSTVERRQTMSSILFSAPPTPPRLLTAH